MGFYEEMRAWAAEVDAEAARLVRGGAPPWDAMRQARRNVSDRRRQSQDDPLDALLRREDGSKP